MRAKDDEIGPPLLGLPYDDIGNAMTRGLYEHGICLDPALVHFCLGFRQYLLAPFPQRVQEFVDI